MPDKQRRLLVISYYFAPHRAIASVRWSKLAKYLTADGYAVDVITTSSFGAVDNLLARELNKMGNIIFIDHADKSFAPTAQNLELIDKLKRGDISSLTQPDSGRNIATPQPQQKRSAAARLKQLIISSPIVKRRDIAQTIRIDNARSADFARQAEEYIVSHGGLGKYDAVISSFGPVGDVNLALRLHELYPDVPLIMDFRDQMDALTQPPKRRREFALLQKKVCCTADAVCAISQGVADALSGCPHKVEIIHNGADPDDFIGIQPQKFERFTMSLTGTVYTDLCDMSPLWRCLRSLIDSGDMDINKISFFHAGRHGEYFRAGMAEYGLDGILSCPGTVGHDESLSIQKGSDALVLAIWNTTENKGIISGKVLEYMQAHKPLVVLINGNEGGSEMRRIVEEGNMGVVHEAPTAASDDIALREYLLEAYRAWISGGQLEYNPDPAVVSSFEYSTLARQYEDFIEKTINK